ncbi:MAG: 50S ribosomal protein L25/general stress protein Ctc [bacterium]|jgi:large subunit ribosomal protein L25|nr:50S ribosomal protein L25/general stress protein Ctc [Betaproteobacteria bacterium]
MSLEVSAKSRTVQGKGASRRLRSAGVVPGILYGGTAPAQSIELEHKALWFQLKSEAFHASILTMDLDGQKQQVLLRDVQIHPWRQLIQHVDFQRVAQDQEVTMRVPLHFVNAEQAQAVKFGGAIVTHIMNEIEVACLPKFLPEFIAVDLSQINVGHSVHMSDLKLPEGVRLPGLARGDSPVASASIPRGAAEEDKTATAAAAPAAGDKKDEKKEPEKKK